MQRSGLVRPPGSGLEAVDRHGASFCIEALEEVLSRNEKPEIFNTDQGSQFTREAFTGGLKENGIGISMEGKGRWRDNVFVERIWKRNGKSVRCWFS
jgi:transposase InsO family protein